MTIDELMRSVLVQIEEDGEFCLLYDEFKPLACIENGDFSEEWNNFMSAQDLITDWGNKEKTIIRVRVNRL